MKQVDILIIGFGIAGISAAIAAHKRGQKVAVFDAENPYTASRSAGAIINPITGRKYNLSWKINEITQLAYTYYKELEAFAGVSIFTEQPIYRGLHTIEAENNWAAKNDMYKDLGYTKSMFCDAPRFAKAQDQKWIQILKGGHVSYSALRHAAVKLIYKGGHSYQKIDCDYSVLHTEHDWWYYGKDLAAKKVIFCEGTSYINNPFIQKDIIEQGKGEALVGYFVNKQGETAHPDFPILKQDKFIIPLGASWYWLGSTLEYEFDSITPTLVNKKLLEESVNDITDLQFVTKAHLAGARPTTHDRRPVLGELPDHTNLFILNGLGTKGFSLGPWCAARLLDMMIVPDSSPLEKEISISRFKNSV